MLNIVIIDDESKVLDGMKYTFKNSMPKHRIVAALQNPLDVFPIMENESVDLVFTDVKMPEMTGVELTARLHELYPTTYIVVLSAYSDYDYVRQCLKNGAFDYLLKPPQYNAIIQTTNRIENLIASKRKVTDRIIEAQQLRATLLNRESFPLEPNKEAQMLVCLPCPNAYIGLSDLSVCVNIFESFFPEDSYPFLIDGYIIVLSKATRKNDLSKVLLEECTLNFRNKGYEAYGTFISFLNKDDNAYKALKTCCLMIDFSVFNRISTVITEAEYLQYMQGIPRLLVTDYISGKVIANMISTKDAQTVDSYLNEDFKNLLSKNQFIEPRKLHLDLVKELFHIANEYEDLDIIALEEAVRPIIFPRSREKVLKWFCECILKIVELTTGSDLPSHVYKAISYINENYMRNITLKEVADSIHLNQWHFSTQFKKTMSVGFTEYLNKVRIKHAKNLLKEKDLKIYQIAEMVGFQEPTYFYTVFKKIEGVSPKDYQLQSLYKNEK